MLVVVPRLSWWTKQLAITWRAGGQVKVKVRSGDLAHFGGSIGWTWRLDGLASLLMLMLLLLSLMPLLVC